MVGVLDSLGLGGQANSGDSGDSSLTPESIAMRRRLAEAMIARGQEDTPIVAHTQGINRALQQILGNYRLGQLDKEDRAGQAAANSQIASVFGGGADKPAAAPMITAPSLAPTPAPASPAQASAAQAGRELPPAAVAAPSGGRLPMGMRVNNPGNIKYNPRLGYAGMQGPSQHTDQGDPQMTFDTPQNGMNAAARLALTKYARGQTTAAAIVAGEGGWTPGNVDAAKNIARTMGVAPDEDLRLQDPARMSKFLQALTLQEHGQASRQYTPEMYQAAAAATGQPNAAAAPQAAAPSAASGADPLMPPTATNRLQKQAIELLKNPRNAALGRELLIKAALAEAPKQPEAVQEYALAVQQGYGKTFMQYQTEMKRAAQQQPEAMQEYAVAQQQGYKGTLQDYQTEMKRAGLQEQPRYEFTKYGIGDKFKGEVQPYKSGNADPELTLEQSKHEQSLRKEFTQLSGDMRTIYDSIGKLRTASKLDSGAGDIAMVYSYMKMLDPNSVVREGEYATAEQVGGAAEKMLGIYNKLVNGARLTPVQRKEFIDAGEGLAAEKSTRFSTLRSQYENVAKKAGADPGRILLDEGKGAVTPPPPAAGGAQAAIDPKAIEILKGNPNPQAMQQFDEVFGPGAAAKALGR